MTENQFTGNNAANTLQGGAGDDLIYGYSPRGPQGEVTSIAATRVASGLDQPLFVVAPPGDLERLFIVEKTGAIRMLDLATGKVLPQPFLDLHGQVPTDGERGLLGLAFDPDFGHNGAFYVDFIRPDGDTEIRRYHVSAGNPERADTGSAETIIRVGQPDGRNNHKAGWLGFGPDGYLYAALGDGGSGGDPDNYAQNPDSLLGKMLRLDVHGDDFPSNAARNYAIPADNPFVGEPGRDEIWALGLRNPWRDSFDRATGQLTIADVGQSAWEEVNIGRAGANYGWRVREGDSVYAGGALTIGTPTAPIHVYAHAGGGSRSIAGGYVYRGPADGLHGDYFFADFITGQVFTLERDGASWVVTERTGQIATDAGAIGNPSSFGEDGAGNLYLVDYGGDIFRLSADTPAADRGDRLLGFGGNDMLFGGQGNDTLLGGDGNDELQGGRGADRLAGASGADVLVGERGGDLLDGGAGRDAMAGGAGPDTYVVDRAGDVVVEAADEGVDTVRSSVTARLGIHVERLVLTGSADVDGFGNSVANTLIGNAGANRLSGEGGRDTMVWDPADRYDGGAGTDTLRIGEDGGAIDLRAVAPDRILDIEAIDLSGHGANTLRLAARDVLDISSTGDALRIEGNAGDVVHRGGGWIFAGVIDGYRTYTQGVATLLVDAELTSVL